MAIATVNMTYSGAGPASSGQIVSQAGLAGDASRVLIGYATATGDASSSTFTVNLIDGTATLGFTPSAIIATRAGGAATSTISVVSVTSITATSFLVTTSAAVNAATFVVGVIIVK
jgi:hypothetical protein